MKKTQTDFAQTLRRGLSQALGASGSVIVDRQRIRELNEQRTLKLKTSANPETTSETMTDESTLTPPETVAQGSTLINGMIIGGSQAPSYPDITKHRAAICECQNCELGATRTNFVYGVGDPNADIMFIGEAPGKNEDEQGEPFVGRAGKLLDKILEAVKLSREEVYIANILKCRPPGNRDPQPAEMEQCFPYLKEQISIIKPKLLCALGRISAQALLDTKSPLGKMRGQWHSYQGIPLRITYHPAALLRNPNFKRGCWEDMQIFREEYDRLLAEEN